MAVLTSAAALVNIAGDVVLIGPAGMGTLGAAVATSVALSVVFVGYLVVAADCAGAVTRIPVVPLLPLGAGLALALSLPGAVGLAVTVVVVPVCARGIQRVTGVFDRGDVDLSETLAISRAV